MTLAERLAAASAPAAAGGAVTDADIDALPVFDGARPDPFASVPAGLRSL